jgi:hypothetical protein
MRRDRLPFSHLKICAISFPDAGQPKLSAVVPDSPSLPRYAREVRGTDLLSKFPMFLKKEFRAAFSFRQE